LSIVRASRIISFSHYTGYRNYTGYRGLHGGKVEANSDRNPPGYAAEEVGREWRHPLG
jgi:hypothetical protein